MSKHTPGPWTVYRRDDYTTPGWVVLWPDASKPGTHYRRLDSNGGFIEQDARLIAAAPELLEVLRTLVEHRSRCFIPEESDFRHLANWTERARAAIAKAEGA